MGSKPEDAGEHDEMTEQERTSQAGDLGRGSHEQSQGGGGEKPVPTGKTPPPPPD